MFEPKHPLTAAKPAQGAEEALRPVSWGELNARLAAARELRDVLGHADSGTAASFDAEVARHVAHLHELQGPQGEDGVNFDDLANGKGPDGNTASRDDERRPATRGIA